MTFNKKIIFTLTLLLLTFFLLFYYIKNNSSNNKINFPITIISIDKKNIINSSEKTIYDVAEKYLRLKSFFNVDISHLQNEIENIKWIKSVIIRRSYPNEIKIYIKEHSPVAIWNEKDYLNKSGDVFTANKINKKLPMLISKNNRNKIIFEYFSIFSSGLTKSNIGEKIIKIEENDIQSLSVTLSSNIVIRLGSYDIKEKINMFFKVYKSLNSGDDLKKIMYIDMRYSNGFSVGWK